MPPFTDPAPRDDARRRGTALLGTLILSLAVAALTATYLTISRAEVNKARIPSARARALYDATGQLARARLLARRSRYDATGHNRVLYAAAGGTIPGTGVRVTSLAGSADDVFGVFYTLEASATYEGITVTARQLVAERESFATYLTLVADADLGIAGLEDPDYDPQDPPALPPAPLSQGKIHTNRQMELFFPGYRHFVNPVTGGMPGGDWVYQVGAEAGKQIFWFEEESRPDAPDIAFPELAAFADVRALVTAGATAVDFPDSWADGLVTVNERGYLVSGDVNALVQFEGTTGTFALTLREQGGSHRTSTVTGLSIPAVAGVVFVEKNFDPQNPGGAPNQTVHVKGDIKGRITIFVPTGNARIAGNIRYLDAGGRPAAIKDAQGIYRKNDAYTGDSTLGIIAEFDVRLGIRPTATTWPETQYHIHPTGGYWVYTGTPGLYGQPVGPTGEYVPEEENLFGYLGGASGNEDAEIHAALFARRGRIHVDGMNPLSYTADTWGYRIGWRNGQWVLVYGRHDAAIYRYGAAVCSRRPVTTLVDSSGNTLVGWGQGQSVYDEDLAINSPPYFFRHNQPVFYDVKVNATDPGSGGTP